MSWKRKKKPTLTNREELAIYEKRLNNLVEQWKESKDSNLFSNIATQIDIINRLDAEYYGINHWKDNSVSGTEK